MVEGKRDWGFPCGSAGKESACNAGDLGSIPGLGRSPGEGKGYPLQYSGLKNSMDCIFHGIAKSRTQLSNFHFQRRLRVGESFWASCGFFFLGRSGLQQTVTRCTQGQYPQHTENFIFMPGGQVARYHSMREGRDGRREPDVVSTVRAQVFAGSKFGLSGCICGLNP